MNGTFGQQLIQNWDDCMMYLRTLQEKECGVLDFKLTIDVFAPQAPHPLVQKSRPLFLSVLELLGSSSSKIGMTA